MAARRAGVITFAGVVFILVGLFDVLDGISALVRPEQFYVGEKVFIVKDYDALGVTLIVLGAIQALVGLGILSRAKPAQIAGVVLAGIGFVVHLAYFKHYPAWSATAMFLDFIVIYALTVHGDEFGKRGR